MLSKVPFAISSCLGTIAVNFLLSINLTKIIWLHDCLVTSNPIDFSALMTSLKERIGNFIEKA